MSGPTADAANAAVLEPVAPAARAAAAVIPRRVLLGCWAGSLVLLLALVGGPPVQRTQEARVLETAREMLGQPWRAWLIPQLNGDLRLRKPPLPYWFAAAAYKVGGVNETAGRVPTAVIGWLTLGVTFLATERLFGTRAGFFAAATLLASYLFFRHTRLAETDAPATLFVTLAVYGVLRAASEGRGRGDCGLRIDFGEFSWSLSLSLRRAQSSRAEGSRAADCGFEERPTNPKSEIRNPKLQDPHPNPLPEYRERGRTAARLPVSALWLHIAAASAGLAFLSKGGPGLFPILFLVGYAAVARRWDVARRFVTSGAAITLLLVGVSWYAFAAWTVGPKQFFQEMRELGSGEDHGAPFYMYFPQILVATVPWSGMVVLGLVEAVRRWRADVRARVVLVWVAACLLPLFVAGNKQFHYLMPLTPALMVLAGWALDAACGPAAVAGDRTGFADAGRSIMRLTVIAAFLAGVLLPFVARHELGRARPGDLVLALGLLVLVFGIALLRKAYGRAVGSAAFAGGCALALVLLLGVWWPTLRPHNTRAVAREIRSRLPEGPYCYVGANFSLPLCFNLRTEIPRATNPAQLMSLVRGHGVRGVIAQTKSGREAPRPADAADGSVRFRDLGQVQGEDQVIELYSVDRRGAE
jgi:4-amino-4-deoxy-L-arabinose transferase-like glycosyltransferase